MAKRVGIMMSTYNNRDIIETCILSCLNQTHDDVVVVVADDGSTDGTLQIEQELEKKHENLIVLPLPHGERGVARKKATEKIKEQNPDYIYIMDSDMILEEDLAEKCIKYLDENPEVGSLVIPEKAYSDFTNFMSKVKVFERNVVNDAGKNVGDSSIEAARFWKIAEYAKSGEINANQIAFEETQPTIRYIKQGGTIKRAVFTGVKHNEKEVTLENILAKKRYYFSVMDKTIESEEGGFFIALKRWYFFRPVLYRPSNLLKYILHPILTIGMLYMYVRLTLIAVEEMRKSKKEK